MIPLSGAAPVSPADEDTLSTLSSENVSVTGKVRRIRLTRLEVGPGHLRLVLTAEGRVRAILLAFFMSGNP